MLKREKNGRVYFRTRIHINGDFVVGDYETEYEAAVAYNKAADMVKDFGINIDFQQNYIEELSAIDYAKIYNKVKISKKIRDFVQGYWFFNWYYATIYMIKIKYLKGRYKNGIII